jgi:hypothetical protein
MSDVHLPATCLPDWGVADLPEPKPLSWRNWASFIGPGIVMCGIQIGGGEWLLGPDVTARYGGGLMWIATVAIVLQVFYNLECGRYALYCGEPIMTGFMRTRPGPGFWMSFILLLNFSALIPGLSTHGAAIFASLLLDRPPGKSDEWLVTILAYVFLAGVSLPIFIGGKIYNMLQAVMTAKVVIVLGFCLVVGLLFVTPANWLNVFSGSCAWQCPWSRADLNGNGKLDDEIVAIPATNSEGTWPLIRWPRCDDWRLCRLAQGRPGEFHYSNFSATKAGAWAASSARFPVPSAAGTSPSATSAPSFRSRRTTCAAGAAGGDMFSPTSSSSGRQAASWAWRCRRCCRCSSLRTRRFRSART